MPGPTGYTFSITPDGGSAANFTQVVSGTGVFALDCVVGPTLRELLRFHARGVAGNVVVRDEAIGKVIRLRGLVVNSLASAWTTVQGYFESWRLYPCTIVDPGSVSYTKMNLVSADIVRLGADGSAEASGGVEIEIEMSFTKDSDF